MPGEKRRPTGDDDQGGGGGLGPDLLDELRSLSQVSKKLRALKAVGLADCESYNLLPDDSLLVKSLMAAGFYVKEKEKENILIEDQAIFTKMLREDLSKRHPEHIKKMLETLTLWFEDDEPFLIKCLRPTKTGIQCTKARSSMQVNFI